MEIRQVTDKEFARYGRIVTNVDFSGLVAELKKIMITDEVVYEPSVKALEESMTETDRDILYGELPIQIGYCGGNNHRLNAVEYHRNSEINVAATDAILLVGSQADVTEGFTYDTAKMEAFFVPAGTAVELYATTLHYAPCNAEAGGFMVGIILLKGTNEMLDHPHESTGEDKLLAAKNKWLIGHPDADLPEGTWLGLAGENLEVK